MFLAPDKLRSRSRIVTETPQIGVPWRFPIFALDSAFAVATGGNGGTSILNAAVVRSDPGPTDGRIVVFEGLDANGNPAQMIWTPGEDLEGWHRDSFTPLARPRCTVPML